MQTNARIHALPEFREPYRSRFAEAVIGGAAARDIHDTDGAGGFDAAPAANTPISERFLERELGRVEMHLRSLCAPLVRRIGHAARVLDAGCGTGGTTVALALSGLAPERVVGFDASAEAIAAARLRAEGYGLGTQAVDFAHVAAGNPLPFEDGAFDLVVCVSVLEFISTAAARRAFVAELLRVVRPGGHLYLATPSPLRLREYHSRRLLGDWRRNPGFPWSSTPSQLRALFPGCAVKSLVRERLRGHPRLGRIGWVAPLLAWAAPWQRLLVQKPG
jgi:SAM-dependent methyltransferase